MSLVYSAFSSRVFGGLYSTSTDSEWAGRNCTERTPVSFVVTRSTDWIDCEAMRIDYDKVLMETLLGFRRAGADFILTYGAIDAAKLLRAGS